MARIPVIIMMDECRNWWPERTDPDNAWHAIHLEEREAAIELDPIFLASYQRCYEEYQTFQRKLEVMFREQRGMPPLYTKD